MGAGKVLECDIRNGVWQKVSRLRLMPWAVEPSAVNGNLGRRTVGRHRAEPQATEPSPVDRQM